MSDITWLEGDPPSEGWNVARRAVPGPSWMICRNCQTESKRQHEGHCWPTCGCPDSDEWDWDGFYTAQSAYAELGFAPEVEAP